MTESLHIPKMELFRRLESCRAQELAVSGALPRTRAGVGARMGIGNGITSYVWHYWFFMLSFLLSRSGDDVCKSTECLGSHADR